MCQHGTQALRYFLCQTGLNIFSLVFVAPFKHANAPLFHDAHFEPIHFPKELIVVLGGGNELLHIVHEVPKRVLEGVLVLPVDVFDVYRMGEVKEEQKQNGFQEKL